MFPYHDENETRRTPFVTYAVIALNVVAWIWIQGAGTTLALARSVCELGLIAGELTGENGLTFSVDFQRPASHTVAAATVWTDPAADVKQTGLPRRVCGNGRDSEPLDGAPQDERLPKRFRGGDQQKQAGLVG